MRFISTAFFLTSALAATAAAANLSTGLGLIGAFGSGTTKESRSAQGTLAGGALVTTHIQPEILGDVLLVNGLQFENLYGESFFNDGTSINTELHGLESRLSGWSSPLWALLPLTRGGRLAPKALLGADLLWIGDHAQRVDPWYDAAGLNLCITAGAALLLKLDRFTLGALARWRAFPGPIVSGWQTAAFVDVRL